MDTPAPVAQPLSADILLTSKGEFVQVQLPGMSRTEPLTMTMLSGLIQRDAVRSVPDNAALREIILDGGLRLPRFDHWRERATSKPSDPDDIRWDCSCGYSGSPEKVRRHWRALAAAPASPAGLDVERVRVVVWDALHGTRAQVDFVEAMTIAERLVAALASPADPEEAGR